jgi:hypothetical protein
MDGLYEFAQRTAVQRLSNNNEKKTPMESGKIKALEEELRSDTIEQKTDLTSEIAGNASQPTKGQGIKLEAIGEQQKSFNSRSNPLGDYTTLLKQMQDDITGASNAMLHSTLESKHETEKLGSASDQFQMLNSQFNLNAMSEQSVKRAKKQKRLSSQDTFI